MPTASKIEEFLRNAPQGPLYVVVAYADVTGLAWLERHAAERPVTLLIGDTRRRLFQGQPPDRRAALDLLARTDVDILSGYRQGAPLVHQKVFVVASPGGDQAVAGLVGSANLTDAGLFRNEETVVTVAWEELPAVWQQTRATCARGRRAGERIAGYIRDADDEQRHATGYAASRRNDPVGTASPRRPVPSGGRAGRGRPPAATNGRRSGASSVCSRRFRCSSGRAPPAGGALLRDQEPSGAQHHSGCARWVSGRDVGRVARGTATDGRCAAAEFAGLRAVGAAAAQPERIGSTVNSTNDGGGWCALNRGIRTGREHCGRHSGSCHRYGIGR